jgi:hypothetical protein
MAVNFSGSRGQMTHDVNFLLPLVDKVRNVFNLRYLLADKAYLSEKNVGTLWAIGIQAVIPVKKRWDSANMKQFYEACEHLVRWFDDRQPEFHSFYRLRSKGEGFFFFGEARYRRLVLVTWPASKRRRWQSCARRQLARTMHRVGK